MGLIQSYDGLIVAGFFLGMAEVDLFPGGTYCNSNDISLDITI